MTRELDVLVVRPPGRPPSPEDRKRLEALRRLVSMLGARLRVEEGEDVAARGDRGRARAGHHLPADGDALAAPRSEPPRLAGPGGGLRSVAADAPPARLPGVDVRIVADPTLRGSKGPLEESTPAGRVWGESGEPSRQDAPALTDPAGPIA